MKIRKMMLLGLRVEKAPVAKAWSKVCQMMIRRERELTFLR